MNKTVAISELSPLMREALQMNREVILTITGYSMAPMLRHRMDKVCLVKLEGRLKKYDLPLYVRSDGRYILHRIVDIKPDGYVTMGDNQWKKEYNVLPNQVIGIVKGFWRNGKYMSCDNFRYWIYCRLWVFTCPIRKFLLKGKPILLKSFRFLKDSSKNMEGKEAAQ